MVKHLVVSEETWLKLNSLKEATDTFEDVINRLLKAELRIIFPEWFEGEIKQIREYLSNLARMAEKT